MSSHGAPSAEASRDADSQDSSAAKAAPTYSPRVTRSRAKKAAPPVVAAETEQRMETMPDPADTSVNYDAVLTDMWSAELCTCILGSGSASAAIDIRDASCWEYGGRAADPLPPLGETANANNSKKSGKPSKKKKMTADDVHKSLKNTSDQCDHDLIEPGSYAQPFSARVDAEAASGSGAGAGARGVDAKVCPERQPFGIVVHPQVSVTCDMHAHMCEAEVIGLLAGYWFDGSSVQSPCPFDSSGAGSPWMFIQQAYPCLAVAIEEDDGSTDVELDAESEWKAREAIGTAGMIVVGWYHSHPKFKPFPSIIDLFNQTQYQTLMRSDESGLEPFVGLIVSTYDKTVKSAPAVHQWFHTVPHKVSGRLQTTIDIPMTLEILECSVRRDFSIEPSNISFEKLSKLFRADGPVIGDCASRSSTKRIAASTAELCVPSKKVKITGTTDVHATASSATDRNDPVTVGFIDMIHNSRTAMKDYGLPAEHAAALLAVVPQRLVLVTLSLVSLGLYYSKHPRRVEIVSEKWKDCGCKLSKLVQSISELLPPLLCGGCSESFKIDYLCKLESFLRACWYKPQK